MEPLPPSKASLALRPTCRPRKSKATSVLHPAQSSAMGWSLLSSLACTFPGGRDPTQLQCWCSDETGSTTSSKMFLVNSDFSSMDFLGHKRTKREQHSTVCKLCQILQRLLSSVIQRTVGIREGPFGPLYPGGIQMKWDCTEESMAAVGGRRPFLCRTVY